MKIIDTEIPDVKLIEPQVFIDERGFFSESYNKEKFNETLGRNVDFVQDNHSLSLKGVLRGLHYQLEPYAQGKLIRCSEGAVFDVAVDIRESSPTFGKWVGIVLSGKNKHQLWVPEGFAHGFITLSERAQIVYKTTNYYAPEYERSILWDDSDIAIQWPFKGNILLSAKDKSGKKFEDAERFP